MHDRERNVGYLRRVDDVVRKGRRTTPVEMEMATAMFSEFPSNVKEFLETSAEKLVKYWKTENGENIPVRFYIGFELSSMGIWGKKMEAPSGVSFVRLHAHFPIVATASKSEIEKKKKKSRESSKIYKDLKREFRRIRKLNK